MARTGLTSTGDINWSGVPAPHCVNNPVYNPNLELKGDDEMLFLSLSLFFFSFHKKKNRLACCQLRWSPSGFKVFLVILRFLCSIQTVNQVNLKRHSLAKMSLPIARRICRILYLGTVHICIILLQKSSKKPCF